MDGRAQQSYTCNLTGGQFDNYPWAPYGDYTNYGTSVSSSGSVGIGPIYGQSPTYGLNCTEYYGNGSPSNAASTIIYSNPYPSSQIVASPSTVSYGQGSTLYWWSAYSDACGVQGSDGSWNAGNYSNCYQWFAFGMPAYGPGNYLYTVYSYTSGIGWVGTSGVWVTVVQPSAPSVSISVSPNPVGYGSGTGVYWSTGGDTSRLSACLLAGGQWGGGVWVGASGSSGTSGLTQATTYSYNCYDNYYGWLGWVSATVGVNPPPTPTASIGASPANIYAGQASIISWSSSNASSCSISGPGVSSGGTSGSVSTGALSAGTKSYSINCSGVGGNASNSATVSVGAIPANCSSGTCSISTSPSTVLLGKPVTISWSCSSSIYSSSQGDANYSTGGALSGSKTLTPATPTCYNLTCTASAGSTSGSSCVNVLVPIITFSTSPLRVRKNTSTPVTFTWNVVNAPAACTITGPSGFSPLTINPVEGVTGSQTTSLTLSQQSIFTFTCTGIGVQSTIKLIPVTQEL